jgi:hypothetical protein
MTKSNRIPVLEVAEILRKYDKHKLNRKRYIDFTPDDFDGVLYVKENGLPRPQDLIRDKEVKKFILENPSGELLEFNSVTEIAEFLDFKSLGNWKRYVEMSEYKLVEQL